MTSEEMKHSKDLWIKSQSESTSERDKDYKLLEVQLNLQKDVFGIIRIFQSKWSMLVCPSKTKAPVFLSKEHRLSESITHTKVYGYVSFLITMK